MSRCYKNQLNNYELEKEKEEFLNNRKYLEGFECCDEQSCDDLAYEYEKLVNKCHDIYGKVGVIPINEKGRLTEASLCDNYAEKMERIKNQYRRGGTKKYKYKKGKKSKKCSKKRVRKSRKASR
jgi:hypothetical protein